MKIPAKLFYIIIAVSFLASCISNKKTVYLQDKDQKKPHDALVDHTYDALYEELLIETGDIISVKINQLQLVSETEYRITSSEEDEMLNRSTTHPYLYGFPVNEDGDVFLPMIGKINVIGLTINEATDKVALIANNSYNDPTVKIFLLNFTVTVLGEVRQPGEIPVYNNKMTVFQALGRVNDMGDYANREAVRIIRTRNNQNRIFHIDLTDETLLGMKELYLQPQDVILVKHQKRKKFTVNDNQMIFSTASLMIALATLVVLINK
jgi:polysaccharide export outer membrane protein